MSKLPKAKPQLRAQAKTLANQELVVIAAYLVGAHAGPADTENIAMQANPLAPGRFSWRKYKEQINIDTVRKRLWDATRPDKGSYLIGSEKGGWRLTKAGYDFAKAHTDRLDTTPTPVTRTSQIERVAQNREISRMLGEAAFLKFTNDDTASITNSDAERFFRIDDYVTGRAQLAKIERFRIMAARHERLSKAITVIAELIREN